MDEVQINRSDLENSLYEYSRLGHGLILGSPGAGKSHSLEKLRDTLLSKGIPSLLIPVDRLGSATPAEIQTHLEIQEPLLEKLISEHNNSKSPAVLIIDGFDAARNLDIQANLLNLIKSLISPSNESWNVLVSVRTFDARKSKDLLKLFPRKSTLEKKYSSKDIDCEHFFIPSLTDNEVLTTKGIDGLENLFQKASFEFKEILRNPFNLWLLEKISKKNQNLEGLDKIASEVQLLDKFWENYISSDADSDKKESVLSSLTRDMVESYSLSVKKDQHYKTELDDSWKSLLSDEIIVLSELTGQRISFSHNILFDHAVSRLVIDEVISEVVGFLTEEPARSLFLRPSLTYYFARLWLVNKNKFWESFSYLLNSEDQNLRVFARLVPASVAVKLFTTAQDLSELDSFRKKKPEIYSEIVTRLLQAYDFIGSSHDREWLLFFKTLCLDLNNQYLWNVAKLTSNILDKSEDSELHALSGEVGRILLKYIWKHRIGPNKSWLDGIGSTLVVPIVAKTFKNNPKEAEKLIRNVLAVIEEENFFIQYLYRLCDLLDFIWPTSPKLVGDIYRTLFNHKEVSTESTSMGTPVMPLLSNRRQDFHMCHYHLERKFSQFVESNPIEAIDAGMDVLNAHAWEDHLLAYSRNREEIVKDLAKFKWRNRTGKILEDHSSIWDSGTSLRDEQVKIANSIFKYFESHLADAKITNQILDLFAVKAEVAFWWKRLLNSGTRNPQVLAEPLFELCLVPQIVDGLSTEYEAVRFCEVAWPFWDSNKKQCFQDFLMNLKSTDVNKQKYTEQLKKKIISRLPKEELTNDSAKQLRDELDSSGEKVANPRPFQVSSSWGGIYTEDEYLKDQGTNLEDPNIKRLKNAWNEVASLTKDLLNGTPTGEQVVSIIEKAKVLFLLLSPNAITNDQHALASGWKELANAAGIITRSELIFGSDNYNFIKKVLLIGSETKNPWREEFDEDKFTDVSYSPYGKTEVAQALPWLARFGKDQDVLNAITKLSADLDPSVRYLLCQEVWRMRRDNLEELWILLEARAVQEKNGVVLGALAYSLVNTFYKDHVRGEKILKHIYEQFMRLSVKDDNIKGTLDIIQWLHLENKSRWASGIISKIIRSPWENLDLLGLVVSGLLEHINVKTLNEREDLFKSAKNEILNLIEPLWKDIQLCLKDKGQSLSEEEIKEVKELYGPIDNIVTRLYFSADISEKLRRSEERKLSNADRERFYKEISPILRKILDEAMKATTVTVFASTAYYFMQLLNGVISYDVNGVLSMAADLVAVSEAANFNLDSMAMREVVSLTETVLADHRADLKNNENIKNLLRLLDSFAKTGWSDALRLVWRLDEIYR